MLRNKLFGSPKKARPVSAPVTTDPFLSYLGPEGKLAEAQVDFEKCRPQCIGKRKALSFALISPISGQQLGVLDTYMFYLPPLAPLSSDCFPTCMAECEEGVRLLNLSPDEEQFKGELSQVGADCKVSPSLILLQLKLIVQRRLGEGEP